MAETVGACDCPDGLISLDCPAHGGIASALVVQAIDNNALIQAQPPGRCELCEAVKETRPYGPNGEEVCFPCGMKDEAAMRRGAAKRFAPVPASSESEERHG